MKKMKSKELVSQSDVELHKKLEELRKNLLSMRFGIATRQMKNVREIRTTKKTIAQILTALSGRAKA
jgi:ribosomal protein L29